VSDVGRSHSCLRSTAPISLDALGVGTQHRSLSRLLQCCHWSHLVSPWVSAPGAYKAQCPVVALLELKLLNTQLQSVEQSTSPYHKQIVSLQLITILWMCAEAAIAIFAAFRAHSVALLGFGADSGIELVSAFVVFLRFKNIPHIDEKR